MNNNKYTWNTSKLKRRQHKTTENTERMHKTQTKFSVVG